MANKNENNGCGWLDFDLKEEFDKESFEKLFEYSKENTADLMRVWLNGDISDINLILRRGTAILSYFERVIAKDSKTFVAFKLGELYGHLNCLNTISYENQQNNLAKTYFEIAKLSLSQYSNYFENVIIKLSLNTGITTMGELRKEISLEPKEMKQILAVLIEHQLLHSYGEDIGYCLTDTGRRLAKQLFETTKS